MQQVLIIGFGKLGSSLARLLRKNRAVTLRIMDVKPYDSAFASVISKDAYFNDLSVHLIESSHFIFICTADDQIPIIVSRLELFSLKNKFVIHTSGVADAEILKVLRKQGAAIGSLHPLQTFNVSFLPAEHWQSIYCTFQGDAKILASLQELLQNNGPKIIEVDGIQKKAVHLAAVVAANFQTALYAWAAEILAETKIETVSAGSLLGPLARQTAQNFSRRELHEILSGPLQRGDLGTIREHVNYLRQHGDDTSLRLYRLLSEKILQNDKLPVQNRDLLMAFFKRIKD